MHMHIVIVVGQTCGFNCLHIVFGMPHAKTMKKEKQFLPYPEQTLEVLA